MKKGRWGLTIYVLCVILLLVLAGSQLASFLNIWTHRGSSETQEYSGGLTQETDQLAGILRPLRMYVSSGENEGRCSLVSDRTGHYGGFCRVPLHLWSGAYGRNAEGSDGLGILFGIRVSRNCPGACTKCKRKGLSVSGQ